jgi:hypothetical protein
MRAIPFGFRHNHRARLNVNGLQVHLRISDPAMPLLYALRNDLGLHGPRFVAGRNIVTLEGANLQQADRRSHGDRARNGLRQVRSMPHLRWYGSDGRSRPHNGRHYQSTLP